MTHSISWNARKHPFQHVVSSQALPTDVFQWLLDEIDQFEYTPYTQNKHRYSARMPDYLLPSLHSLAKSTTTVLTQFNNRGFLNCRWECTLCKDIPPYTIGPHPDRPNKHLTLLVYLQGSTIDGTILHNTPQPFVPNTAIAFVPAANTIHRVDPIHHNRYTLQMFLKKHSQGSNINSIVL